jgi:hypothetical protein
MQGGKEKDMRRQHRRQLKYVSIALMVLGVLAIAGIVFAQLPPTAQPTPPPQATTTISGTRVAPDVEVMPPRTDANQPANSIAAQAVWDAARKLWRRQVVPFNGASTSMVTPSMEDVARGITPSRDGNRPWEAWGFTIVYPAIGPAPVAPATNPSVPVILVQPAPVPPAPATTKVAPPPSAPRGVRVAPTTTSADPNLRAEIARLRSDLARANRASADAKAKAEAATEATNKAEADKLAADRKAAIAMADKLAADRKAAIQAEAADEARAEAEGRISSLWLLVPIALALLVGLYFLIRPKGGWRKKPEGKVPPAKDPLRVTPTDEFTPKSPREEFSPTALYPPVPEPVLVPLPAEPVKPVADTLERKSASGWSTLGRPEPPEGGPTAA